MKLNDAVILWNPRTKHILVTPQGSEAVKDSATYPKSAGAVDADFREEDERGRLVLMFSYFVDFTARDALDPRIVHQAFCTIDEFRFQVDGEEKPENSP